MTLVETFTVGRLRCHLLDAGRQLLDGGAMFGVVPKPLWERRIQADARNRIPLALRCLLVEHERGLVLVDTGIGNKEPQKFVDIYGVDNAGVHGPTRLEDAIVAAGFAPKDVAWVVNTHLHFDHAGGNTVAVGGSDADEPEVVPAFPGATYVVQAGELAFAGRDNERIAASYIRRNYRPVEQAGLWKTVEGETELVPGIRLLPTPGHTPHHQSVLIEDGGETACFLADLVPTTAHVPLPWIMGYDLEPLVTLETKRTLLARAEAEEWTLLFEHDPERGRGKVVKDGKTYAYEPISA